MKVYDIIIRQEKVDSPTYATAYTDSGVQYAKKFVPSAKKFKKFELTAMPSEFLKGSKGLRIGGVSPDTYSVRLINPPLH